MRQTQKSSEIIRVLASDIKSVTIGIIHLSDLPLCSLRSLWLNHTDATVNDMTHSTDCAIELSQDLRKTIRNAAILVVSLPPGWRRYVIVRKSCKS